MIDLTQHSPNNLWEAVAILYEGLDQSEHDYIVKYGAEPLHHTAGQALRNAWLWDDPSEGDVKPLAQDFRERFGLGHADDMSGMILSGLTARVRGMGMNHEAEAHGYRLFWANQHINPMTLEAEPEAQAYPAYPEEPKRSVFSFLRSLICR